MKLFSDSLFFVRCYFLSAIATSLFFATVVKSQNIPQKSNFSLTLPSSTSINNNQECPTDIVTLTTRLLQDIPDYSNRVIQRTQDAHQEANIYNYIIIAGQPELEPLNLPKINYHSESANNTEQIFFTTLERQYNDQQKIERETYHWLFVTLTKSGWHLVTMYSRFGNETKNTPPTPPQESSNGIIGQAVSLWLRDCRANALHQN